MEKKIKKLPWITFFIFALLFFTFLKIPEHKIKNLIKNSVSSQLEKAGFYLHSESEELSLLFGLNYVLKGVKLQYTGAPHAFEFDEVSVSPSLLSLVTGKLAGSFSAIRSNGKIKSDFSINRENIETSFKIENLDPNQFGILPALTTLKANGSLDGNGEFSLNPNNLSTLDGEIKISIHKINVPTQTLKMDVFGNGVKVPVRVPALSLNQGNIQLLFENGKGRIKEFKFGDKKNPQDDLALLLEGDIHLKKSALISDYNLKAFLDLTDRFEQRLGIARNFLNSYKKDKGSYALKAQGTFSRPQLPSRL